jgi:hypothetical protein
MIDLAAQQLRERWVLEHVLITLQQRQDAQLLDVCQGVIGTIEAAYRATQVRDPRWRAPCARSSCW